MSDKKGQLRAKLKTGLKKGAKKLAIVAAGWAAGAVFPAAGAALFSFMKGKMSTPGFPINMSDEKLNKLCNVSIGEKSVDSLKRGLRKQALGQGISESKLDMVLSTVLRPLNKSLDEATKYIKKNYHDTKKIKHLLEDWKDENTDLIEQFQLDMDSSFDILFTTLEEKSDEILAGIDGITRRLAAFERSLDSGFATGARGIFGAETIESGDLKVTSQAQIAMANYSSRFDIGYDDELFIRRREADRAFQDFLMDATSAFSSGKNVFLVLAGAGMGKTWTLASWAHRLSDDTFDVEDVDKILPFFISLKSGLDVQMGGFFGAKNKNLALNNLIRAKDTTDITPILFMDGLDEITPADAAATLNFIADLSKQEIPVVLSCRDTDWSKEDRIIEKHSDLKDNCYEHMAGESFNIKGITCPPSLYLQKFNDSEFDKVIVRYDVPPEAFGTPEIREMAKRPIILRLFSEHYSIKGFLPNPGIPSEFEVLFLGEKNAPPETSILGRYGIFGQKRSYLVRLTLEFAKLNVDILDDFKLSNLLKEKDNFNTIRSSGLIIEEWSTTGSRYKLNPLYKKHLISMVQERLQQVGTGGPSPGIARIAPKAAPKEEGEYLYKKLIKAIREGRDVDYFEYLLSSKKGVKQEDKTAVMNLVLFEKIVDKEINYEEFMKLVNILKTEYTTFFQDPEANRVFAIILLESEISTWQPKKTVMRENIETLRQGEWKKFRNELTETIQRFLRVPDELIETIINDRLEKRGKLHYVDDKLGIKSKSWDRFVEKKQKIINKKVEEYNELMEKGKGFEGATQYGGAIEMYTKAWEIADLLGWTEEQTGDFKTLLADLRNKKREYDQSKSNKAEQDRIFEKYGIDVEEGVALEEIENLIGRPIPKEKFVNWTKVGYVKKGEHVLSLSLANCGLDYVPASIKDLDHLEKLNLYNNKFTQVPNALLGMTSLKELDLGKNQIKSLTDKIGSFTTLRKLNLCRNQLHTLPMAIMGLSGLKELNLLGNNFKTIPISIENLSSLNVLNFGVNPLASLPSELMALNALTEFNMINNDIVKKEDKASQTILRKLRSKKVGIITGIKANGDWELF